MKINPLDDRVVVRPNEAEETTAGGIVLPDAAKEKQQRGTVLAVGPGRLLDSGDAHRSALRWVIRFCLASTAGQRSRLTAKKSRFCERAIFWRSWSSDLSHAALSPTGYWLGYSRRICLRFALLPLNSF